MGTKFSKTKYVLIYGEQGSGKTLMLYNMQASVNVFEDLKPTIGFNYEEIAIDNLNIGLFDVSGDPKQYPAVDTITKSVKISGLIFIVSLLNIDQLNQSKELLNLVLGNKYLDSEISLFVVYNINNKLKDKANWLSCELLDQKMGLNNTKERFKLRFYTSCMCDISSKISNNFTSSDSTFTSAFETFVENFEKN